MKTDVHGFKFAVPLFYWGLPSVRGNKSRNFRCIIFTIEERDGLALYLQYPALASLKR